MPFVAVRLCTLLSVGFAITFAITFWYLREGVNALPEGMYEEERVLGTARAREQQERLDLCQQGVMSCFLIEPHQVNVLYSYKEPCQPTLLNPLGQQSVVYSGRVLQNGSSPFGLSRESIHVGRREHSNRVLGGLRRLVHLQDHVPARPEVQACCIVM